jgi:hypothetical protein
MRADWSSWASSRTAAAAAVVVIAVVAGSAACTAGGSQSNTAATSGSTGTAATSERTAGTETRASAAPIPVLPSGRLDPDRIDLSGHPGTTPAQQRAAEELLRNTIRTLPRWADYETAVRDGFVTLDGGIVGVDHMMHWDWLNDGRVFDPSHPESLVYRVDPTSGARTLEAAMFFLPDGATIDNTPDTFGSLVQYHVHGDLCFERGATTNLRGLVDASGNCPPGTEKLPNPMAHVWIVPHECGPFASLEGIGGGQTKSGTPDCDSGHGSHADPSAPQPPP